MTADPEQIDRNYAEIRSRREKVRLFDSPRERWRKYYDNFVREVEWALHRVRAPPAQDVLHHKDVLEGSIGGA
jgi:hypothetical protein